MGTPCSPLQLMGILMLHAVSAGFCIQMILAFGYVLIARPEYMLEKDIGKIIEATLSSGTNVRLKMQGLQNMYKYLLDAESQLGADKATENVIPSSVGGSNSVPVAAGAR